MDIFNFLKEKKKEAIGYVHPFAYSDNTFKYLYCFGLGVLAYGHMIAIIETKNSFNTILENINLHTKDRDRIIVDINNNFDYKIGDVFKILDTKEKQYIFTADLLKISSLTLWAQDYCENVTKTYMSVFDFTNKERVFLVAFLNLSRKHKLEEAKNLYDDFVSAGYNIRYHILQYMCGDILMEETYENLILEQGETLIIDRPTTILGDVIIKNGSSLKMLGAEVKIDGSIQVEKGRISIKNSNLFLRNTTQKVLLRILDSAFVNIEDSVIDCNFKCGMLHQMNGSLFINNSKISHTKGERGIIFSGENFTMNGTIMEDALGGGLSILDKSNASINACNFYHCEAEHGGAIYFNSLHDARITNCRFKNCNAKYIGGAIYFSYKKYGQELNNCEFIKCLPKDSIVFNDYGSKSITYEGESYEA